MPFIGFAGHFIALSRPTLVVRFDNALLFTVPVIGYDAAVGVPVTEKIRCTVLSLCPLHYNAVIGILHVPQVALASVDFFHAVTATEEHVRHG